MVCGVDKLVVEGFKRYDLTKQSASGHINGPAALRKRATT